MSGETRDERQLFQRCECDDPWHSRPGAHRSENGRCTNEAADHGDVVTSPALCMPCLFGCGDDGE